MQTAARILYEQWEREQLARGTTRGMASLIVDLYEGRLGPIPTDLRAVIEATQDEATLRAWHRLAVTGSAEEIAATIRQSTTT